MTVNDGISVIKMEINNKDEVIVNYSDGKTDTIGKLKSGSPGKNSLWLDQNDFINKPAPNSSIVVPIINFNNLPQEKNEKFSGVIKAKDESFLCYINGVIEEIIDNKSVKILINNLTDLLVTAPSIIEDPKNDDKTYKLIITTSTGSFVTPNLKGADGAAGSGGSLTENDYATDEDIKDLFKDFDIGEYPPITLPDYDFNNWATDQDIKDMFGNLDIDEIIPPDIDNKNEWATNEDIKNLFN